MAQNGADVFLSYSRAHAIAVEVVGRALEGRGLKPFLDRWYLIPGQSWPEALEQHLVNCRAVAVFLGPEGIGSWQQREVWQALDRQAHEPGFPVIPVLLPGLEDLPRGFLSLSTWIDLRAGLEDEASLDALAKAIRREPPAADAPQLVDPRAAVCPYRGLDPFREEDAPFFFGREAYTRTLVEKVGQRSFVAVVGASGGGKSSVVRAGLVPALRQGAAGRVWEMAVMVPTDRPMHSLAEVLLPLMPPEGPAGDAFMSDPHERRKLINRRATDLHSGEVSLRDCTEEILARQRGTERLLLVVDQWEELYTIVGKEAATDESHASAARLRQHFIDQLLEATTSAPLTVVLTIRGDFIGQAFRNRTLADRLQDAQVNLGPMRRDEEDNELRRAIEQPAAKVGLQFQEGLVERILTDVGDEPGNLPLLEFVLTELWRERDRGGELTHEAYDGMGGLAKSIAQRANAELEEMAPEQVAAARHVLVQLVRPGEGEADTRDRLVLPDNLGLAKSVIDKLVKARLLVTSHDMASGKEILEVAHEALIRSWDQLGLWVEEDRNILRARRRVREAMRYWQENGERDDLLLRPGLELEEGRKLLTEQGDAFIDEICLYIERSIATAERSQRSRLRIVVASVGLLAVVTAIAVYFGVRSTQIAILAEEQAINQAWSVVDLGRENPGENMGQVEALEYIHSRRVSLDNVKLRGVALYQVDLTGAGLNVADLRDANLIGAELGGTNLRTADLSNARLIRANLKNAILSKAILTDADLSAAELDGAHFCDTTMPDGSSCNRDCTPNEMKDFGISNEHCPWLATATSPME